MKKFNKNILRAFTLAFVLGIGTGCDVTDLQPKTALSESTAFSTPERIELAVAGIYDAAQSGFYLAGAVRGYPFGAAHVAQGDMRGEDMSLAGGAVFYAVTYQSTYDASSPNNGFMWQTLYNVINKANVVIAGIKGTKPTGTLTQDILDGYEAEARFLRALSHHQLLIHWARPYGDNPTAAEGGIPYRMDPVGTATGVSVDVAIKQKRNTVAECYDKLLEDLDFAENKLPITRKNQLTRATKGAAIALKTRIRLHQNKWSDVVREADKIVTQTAPFTSSIGGYRLTATPLGAFGAANKNNTESIFSIENDATDNSGTNGALPTMYSAASLTGRAIVCISPVIWNQAFWDAEDLRRNATAVTRDGSGFRFSNKYTDISGRGDNAPIIRYAEVLLNAAEAIVRSTNTVDTRAVALLNAVRNRAVTNTAKQYTTSSFASSGELLTAILNERRIEFLAEGLRWADIHRLSGLTPATGGIPAKINSALNFSTLYQTTFPGTNPIQSSQLLPAISYTDGRFLWPVPAEELFNNPNMKQNPGY